LTLCRKCRIIKGMSDYVDPNNEELLKDFFS